MGEGYHRHGIAESGEKTSSVCGAIGEICFLTQGHRGPKHPVTLKKKIETMTVHIILGGIFDAVEISNHM